MEDCHATTTPCQQQIWKVSHTLDQLDVMCEQHHLQTKHVDGLPDWAVHKAAAGIASPVRRDVPPNFAWHDYDKVDCAKEGGEGGDEQATLQLGASTSDLQPQLTPPSVHNSVSSTPAVPPLSTAHRLLEKSPKPHESSSRDRSSNESNQSMGSRHENPKLCSDRF